MIYNFDEPHHMMYNGIQFRDYATYTSVLRDNFKIRVQVTHKPILPPDAVANERIRINSHLHNIDELYHIQAYRGYRYTFVWFMADISALAFMLTFNGKIV